MCLNLHRLFHAQPGTHVMILAIGLAACGGRAAASAPGGGASHARPAEYVESEVASEASQLIGAQKPHEAVALLKPHLAANPKDASGQFELGRAYNRIAFDIKWNKTGTQAERVAALEHAAEAYWAFVSLTKDLGPSVVLGGLIGLNEVYSSLGLKRPADAEKVAERMIALLPGKAGPYAFLTQAMRDSGRHSEATALLRKLRFDLAVTEQDTLVNALWRHLNDSPELPRSEVEGLVSDLRLIGEGSLATRPEDPAGPHAMYTALYFEALRLETNPKRKQELLSESERWEEIVKAAPSEIAKLLEKLKAQQQQQAERRK